MHQDRGDRFGDIFIIAGEQLRGALHDGDTTAEPSKQLPELESDVAATEHHEVLGNFPKLHDGRAV